MPGKRKAPIVIQSVDLTTLPVTITGLSEFSEICIVSTGVVSGAASSLLVQPSSDGGSTFYTDAVNDFHRAGFKHDGDFNSDLPGFQMGVPNGGNMFSTIYNWNVAVRSFSMFRPSHQNTEPRAYRVWSQANASVAYDALKLLASGAGAFTSGTAYVVGRRDPLDIIFTGDYGAGVNIVKACAGYAQIHFWLQATHPIGGPNILPRSNGQATQNGAGGGNYFLTHTNGQLSALAATTGSKISFGLSNGFTRSMGVIHNVDMAIPTILGCGFQTNDNPQGRCSYAALFTDAIAMDGIEYQFPSGTTGSRGLQMVGNPNA